mmetsp:Transcript_24546/g.48153  ORF Transcript_24546/g.48153 Transcript_24546/m.48153 type:complete len:140 (-) Transcript_24546:458-877(-)
MVFAGRRLVLVLFALVSCIESLGLSLKGEKGSALLQMKTEPEGVCCKENDTGKYCKSFKTGTLFKCPYNYSTISGTDDPKCDKLTQKDHKCWDRDMCCSVKALKEGAVGKYLRRSGLLCEFPEEEKVPMDKCGFKGYDP